MAKTAKKKAPSKFRYDLSHPTISCRVDKDTYDRLKAVNKAKGNSFADVLKIGLGTLEAIVHKESALRKKGYDEGFPKAQAEARRFVVEYPCSVCGKKMLVHSDAEKAAIAKYMTEIGWGHAECHQKNR